MDTLRSYIETQLSKDRLRREETLSLIRHALPLFTKSTALRDSTPQAYVPYWPYERSDGNVPSEVTLPESHSNTLMIAAALQQLCLMKLPDTIFDDCKWESKTGREAVASAVGQALVHLIKLGTEKNERLKSTTYGNNSVFAFCWLYDLLADKELRKYLPLLSENSEKEKLFSSQKWLRALLDDAIKNKRDSLNNDIKSVAADNLKENLWENYVRSPAFKDENGINQNHAFPILKTIHLYEFLSSEVDSVKDLELPPAAERLYQKLLSCVSLAYIANSQFDAAELVFSLEAYLRLRRLQFIASADAHNLGALLCDEGLLRKVFSILAEKQKVSVYWRPLTPFVSDEKGMALLPISAELVLSLLRICDLLGPLGERLFAEYSGIFEVYFDWLKSRMIAVQSSGDALLYGWCSEHTYKPNVIQLWQTSQIVLFLAKYYVFQRRKTAADALAKANLTTRWPKAPGKTPEEQEEELETFWRKKLYGSDSVHVQIKKDIAADSASFLLYGPPGTGKTFFAEMIAAEKKWRLLELSPGDFIADGTEGVENKAKNLFQVLYEQEDLVIIFDEIDRLLLDRSSSDYKEQADMFQFMVASLLTKFKALRETPRIIFLICTNYAHRIDPAIVRPGRIDRKMLVLSPDLAERTKHAEKQLKKRLNPKNSDPLPEDWEGYPEMIAEKTALYSYVELNQLCKDLVAETKDDATIREETLDTLANQSPAIAETLKGYRRQVDEASKKESGERLPLDEYLMCLYAKYEPAEKMGDPEKEAAVPSDIRLPSAQWENALKKVGEVMGDSTRKKVAEAKDYLIVKPKGSSPAAPVTETLLDT